MEAKTLNYNNKYLSLNPDWHWEDAPRKFHEITQILPLEKYDRMLDIGCGIGVLTRIIADYYRCGDITGLDISKTAIEKATELDKAGQVNWVKGDIFSLTSNIVYDVVLCVDVIEHLKEVNKFFKVVRGLAKLMVVRLPIEQTILNSLMRTLLIKDEYERLEKKYGHINHFTPVAIKKLLKQLDFEILDYKAFSIPPRTSLWLDFFRRLESLTIASVPDLTLRLFGGFLVLLISTNHEYNRQ